MSKADKQINQKKTSDLFRRHSPDQKTLPPQNVLQFPARFDETNE